MSFRTNDRGVVIASRTRAGHLLSSTNTRPQIGAVVAIRNPDKHDLMPNGHRFAHGVDRVPDRICFSFWDLSGPRQGYDPIPNREQVERLVDWLRPRLHYFTTHGHVFPEGEPDCAACGFWGPDLAGDEPAPCPNRKRLLIHCLAGQSRSTACAVVGYALALGAGSEARAFARAQGASEDPDHFDPNGLILLYADAILKRGGALYRCGPKAKYTNPPDLA